MRLTTGITGTAGAPLGPNACSEPQGSRDELAALARTGTRHHHESRGGALKPLFRHDTPVRRPESNRVAGSLNQCVTIRLGLQIPSFSYGTSVAELFAAVRAQAQEAEAAGFDTCS